MTSKEREAGRRAFCLAIERAGGISALARRLGEPHNTLIGWRDHNERGVPAERCAEIERITGVPRQALRPDIGWIVRHDGTRGNHEHHSRRDRGSGIAVVR